MSLARHTQDRPARSGRALRWTAGLLGVGVAAATALAVALPAEAATTVPVQLTPTGTAYANGLSGGSVVGVHPGVQVQFSASGIPSVALPSQVTGVLNGLIAALSGYQITVTSSAVPGLPTGTKLGGCSNLGDAASATTPALSLGQYDFSYSIQSLALFCAGAVDSLTNTQLNQLKAAGVALNASNQYVGHVVVADNPPSGGLGVQLPTVTVAPSLPVVGQLPTITVPGVTVTVPTTIPSIPGLPGLPGLPGTGTSTGSTGNTGTSTGGGLTYTQPGLTVPDEVVPKGGSGGLYGGAYGGASGGAGNSGLLGLAGATPLSSDGTSASGTTTSGTSGKQTVDLASNKAPSAQMPVLLAILAILALSLVAAAYARLYLLRRTSL
jgi:hypothetical protein